MLDGRIVSVRSGTFVPDSHSRSSVMREVEPWHSLRENVHHNHSECARGKDIEPGSWRKGTGSKPLCRECGRLSLGRDESERETADDSP